MECLWTHFFSDLLAVSAGRLIVTGHLSAKGLNPIVAGNPAGIATLEIVTGGSVSSGPVLVYGGSNTKISGPASLWRSADFRLGIGVVTPAVLTIDDGGVLDSTGTVFLGINAGQNGAATITGVGSSLLARDMNLGWSGNGTVTVEGDGLVDVNGSSTLGVFVGSIGTATLDGDGALWRNSEDLHVGAVGAGTITSRNGGQIEVAKNTFIASAAGGRGQVDLLGPRSRWSNAGDFYVGWLSTGAMTVANGSSLKTGTLRVGDQTGSAGTVTITDRGQVSSVVTSFGGVPGARGSGTIDGRESVLRTTEDLYVGTDGDGTLTIQNEGVAGITRNAFIAAGSPSTGRVVVTGGGSQLNSNYLLVGYAGSGELTIREGARVTNTVTNIGGVAGSHGIATIDGRDSVLSTVEDSHIGLFGEGTLTVQNRGVVTIGRHSFINAGGTVTLQDAGQLAVGGDTVNNGTVTVGDATMLNVTGKYTQPGSGRTVVAGTGVLAATSIIIDRGVLAGDGRVTGSTTISAGAALIPGSVADTGGSLEFSAGPLIIRGDLRQLVSAVGFGVVNAVGSVELGSDTSVLDLRTAAGYDPPVGTRVVILTAGAPVAGRFSRIINAEIGFRGKTWQVRYNSGGNDVVLEVACTVAMSVTSGASTETPQCGLPRATIVADTALMPPSRFTSTAPLASTRPLEVKCLREDGTATQCNWRLRVLSTADSDIWSGHSGGSVGPHVARPLGWLTRDSSTPDPTQKDYAPQMFHIASDGEIATVVYTAYSASGRISLNLDCPDGSCEPSEPMEMSIGSPRLRTMTASLHVELGLTRHHARNHFVRDGDQADYHDLWTLFKDALVHRGVPLALIPTKFVYSAFSLEWGGLYDIFGDWGPPHSDHLNGINADIDAVRSGLLGVCDVPECDEYIDFAYVFQEVVLNTGKFWFLPASLGESPDSGIVNHYHLIHK